MKKHLAGKWYQTDHDIISAVDDFSGGMWRASIAAEMEEVHELKRRLC